MVQRGTVRNGVIVPDGPPPPEGTEVVFEPADADAELWDELEHVQPPPATETREEFLASLRRSIAAAEAGVKGASVDEVFAEIDRELARKANREG